MFFVEKNLFCLKQCSIDKLYLLDCIPFVLNKSSYSRLNGNSTQNKSNGSLVKVYAKLIQLLWTKSIETVCSFFFYFNKNFNDYFSDIINPSSVAIEIR